MKVKSVFIGDIKKVVETKNIDRLSIFERDMFFRDIRMEISKVEIFKKDAILIELPHCVYLDLDTIHSDFVLYKINKKLEYNKKVKFGDIILRNHNLLCKKNDLYVEQNSIRPYVNENLDSDNSITISVRQLKKIIKSQKKYKQDQELS